MSMSVKNLNKLIIQEQEDKTMAENITTSYKIYLLGEKDHLTIINRHSQQAAIEKANDILKNNKSLIGFKIFKETSEEVYSKGITK